MSSRATHWLALFLLPGALLLCTGYGSSRKLAVPPAPAMAPSATPMSNGIDRTGTYLPPGGSAPWSTRAEGCKGVPLPDDAEPARASDTGVTPDEIRLGTTQPLTGNQSVLYLPNIKGFMACIDAVNAGGGIYGRTVHLLVEDDVFSGMNTRPLLRKLVERLHVFAVASPLGTPTVTEAWDYLNEQRVPNLFIQNGASRFETDLEGHPWSFGFQPDYDTEAQVYAKYIQQSYPGKRVGVLYQDDEYGKEYLQGLQRVLGEQGTPDNPIVAVQSYISSSRDIAQQLRAIEAAGVEVLVLFDSPFYTGQALHAAATDGWKPAVLVTDLGLDVTYLSGALGGADSLNGVIVNQYFHAWTDANAAVGEVKDLVQNWQPEAAPESDPGMRLTRHYLATAAPAQSPVNYLFGYMIAEAWIETLKRAGVNPTRASLVRAAESFEHFELPQLLPGITLNTGPTNHRPINCVQPGRLMNGAWQPLGSPICVDRQAGSSTIAPSSPLDQRGRNF